MENILSIMNSQDIYLLMSFCEQRFKQYKDPCKLCKYRSKTHQENIDCMFKDCPRDWRIKK